MGRSKKPFIDKKNSSTYHLLYRSQRDVSEDPNGGDGNEAGVILWPSPNNNKSTDGKVLLGKTSDTGNNESTLETWKTQLSQAGLVDDYNYDKHMKPITGTGMFFDSSGNRGTSALEDPRSKDFHEDLVQEVDRQLESIALTADCMDKDIAQALFGEFDDGEYEELNDEFFVDAAQDMEGKGEAAFDFAAHIQSLMDKARLESEETEQLTTIHEQARQDQEFFAKSKALGHDYDEDDDEFAHLDGDLNGAWHVEGTPGIVPKLNEAEEKALCDKFQETLLEYESDDIGEGADDEEAMGPLPLEGDQQVEAALEEYLEEKKDGVFMAGARHYLEGDGSGAARGGSGFSALVGKKMVPAKELDEYADVQGDIRPVQDVLGEADGILGSGRHAPPAEEIFIDGKSYFSERMRNPWDCESILSTYSNLDNKPLTIGAGSGRRRKKKNKKAISVAPEEESVQRQHQQILLSDKTGLPLGVLPDRDGDDDGVMETYVSVNRGEARSKQETTEEKRLRKQTVKKERQVARLQKKMMKEAFTDELTKRQHEVLVDDVGGKSVFRF